MQIQTTAFAVAVSACLEKARALLLVLQPLCDDLVLMMELEVLLWSA